MSDPKNVQHGTISIHTENIFPIIKKWLYSEKEIFLRELVSNAVDAIHKLGHINVIEGLQLSDEYGIDISLDKEAGTLTIKDNGIGMTGDEICEYITQIAFSSAEKFVEKFKDLDDKNQIIGHFGLGFYSSFMVSDKVEIKSLSYQEGAKGAFWCCDGTTSYDLAEIEKSDRGTEIVLYLSDEEKEFLEPARVKNILTRYCNFLPVAIRLDGEVVNDQNPLWAKSGSEVTEEEYREFYKKLYPFSQEPLFWIHLNIDYPFNLKGILYFPKLTNEFDVTKSHIKLFCNQVFVSDNCPELIPEFLTPLQGCLDAPDLPLNVSRSYLQNEPQVRKINEVISGRIGAKIAELAKKDRETFSDIWENIHTFIKYGMMNDEKFYGKVKDQVVYRSTGDDKYTTLPEYLERAKEVHENKVYYANDETAQATYLKLFKSQGMEVLILDAMIDTHFTQFLEMKDPEVKFQRVDSDITENLIEEDKAQELVEDESGKSRDEKLKGIFEDLLSVKGLEVRVEGLKESGVAAMVLLSEQSRRLKEMTRMMSQEQGDLFDDHTLLVNSASPVVQNILKLKAEGEDESVKMLVEQVYDLATLSQKAFDKERLEAFLERSNRILESVSIKS